MKIKDSVSVEKELRYQSNFILEIVEKCKSQYASTSDSIDHILTKLLPLAIPEDDVSQLRKRIFELEGKLHTLKRQVREKDESLRTKNIQLDAYHHVWCDGGCAKGVHRFHDEELTEEIVLAAEYGTKRLRTKYENFRWQKIQRLLTQEEHDAYRNDPREYSVKVKEIQERFKDVK